MRHLGEGRVSAALRSPSENVGLLVAMALWLGLTRSPVLAGVGEPWGSSNDGYQATAVRSGNDAATTLVSRSDGKFMVKGHSEGATARRHRARSRVAAAEDSRVLATVARGPGAECKEPDSSRMYIYRDAKSNSNNGEWANWMPDSGASSMMRLNLESNEGPLEGGTCIAVEVHFDKADQSWCGIAVGCRNCWGQQASEECYDLRRARALVFWARGATGGERIQVKAAITGDQPFGDSLKTPVASEWYTLTNSWTMYQVPLPGQNMQRIITPFVFVTAREKGERNAFTFFLDEIYVDVGCAP